MNETANNLNAAPSSGIWVVVPCYNEAARLPRAEFEQFAGDYPEIQILFVNDGSRDTTLELLHSIAAQFQSIHVLNLPQNMGKAEAVRAGFNQAFQSNPELIGYWDADLATPLREVPVFAALLRSEPETQMALGSRVQLLGRHIHRKLSRHYIGRAFATFASLYLGLRIYDTQCGAKLFRNSPLLREIFSTPWIAKWLFDVELLVRYLKRMRGKPGEGNYGIHEIPLEAWEDVAGSKVKATDFLKAWLELLKIMIHYGRPLRGSSKAG